MCLAGSGGEEDDEGGRGRWDACDAMRRDAELRLATGGVLCCAGCCGPAGTTLAVFGEQHKF